MALTHQAVLMTQVRLTVCSTTEGGTEARRHWARVICVSFLILAAVLPPATESAPLCIGPAKVPALCRVGGTHTAKFKGSVLMHSGTTPGGTRGTIRDVRDQPAQLHARQAPYPLYCCSSPERACSSLTCAWPKGRAQAATWAVGLSVSLRALWYVHSDVLVTRALSPSGPASHIVCGYPSKIKHWRLERQNRKKLKHLPGVLPGFPRTICGSLGEPLGVIPEQRDGSSA